MADKRKSVSAPKNRGGKYHRYDDDLAPNYTTTPTNPKSLNQSPQKKVKKTLKPAPSLFIVHLAIIAAQVAFGGGSVIGALGMPETNPVLFALIREGIAGPLLCLVAYIVDKSSIIYIIYNNNSLHRL